MPRSITLDDRAEDAVARALALVGHKWTLLIIRDLMRGPLRFTEIQRSLRNANPKMITARLRELEGAGLVSRTTYAEVPPRVEYALTERGRALRPVIDGLRRWGSEIARAASAS
ncbi:MAG: winged helix-turn-helix transcriptional regulator [Candidatus Limnocylindria bacterium]